MHTRDALDLGFPDPWGLDLLWRLLRWDPMERISVSDALEHAYFAGPYRSRRDGSLHATQRYLPQYRTISHDIYTYMRLPPNFADAGCLWRACFCSISFLTQPLAQPSTSNL